MPKTLAEAVKCLRPMLPVHLTRLADGVLTCQSHPFLDVSDAGHRRIAGGQGGDATDMVTILNALPALTDLAEAALMFAGFILSRKIDEELSTHVETSFDWEDGDLAELANRAERIRELALPFFRSTGSMNARGQVNNDGR